MIPLRCPFGAPLSNASQERLVDGDSVSRSDNSLAAEIGFARSSPKVPMIPAVIAQWHQAVKSRDPVELESLLDERCVFQSPAVHKPQAGKALTHMYLHAALKVLNNDDFHYLSEWYGERSAVLEFATTVDGVEVNGVDIVHWNEGGKIVNFKVMMRPLKAINTIIPKMAHELEALAAGRGKP